ncbi:hypothetical protein MAPG_10386 [Magnaporthiopsis poae ATCC 64411]|uniref:Uncharacterized protein n=1 Tax=Magnaporthiopsis poae (strain ATCC 64411 / 73-15) TaxID=644358 RepID=A0A0C4ECG2_MAGP6|nr:hypothetical protein MAPG_10386 [Magnaporthiopsis poae ATCC 64411]
MLRVPFSRTANYDSVHFGCDLSILQLTIFRSSILLENCMMLTRCATPQRPYRYLSPLPRKHRNATLGLALDYVVWEETGKAKQGRLAHAAEKPGNIRGGLLAFFLRRKNYWWGDSEASVVFFAPPPPPPPPPIFTYTQKKLLAGPVPGRRLAACTYSIKIAYLARPPCRRRQRESTGARGEVWPFACSHASPVCTCE